MITNGIEKEAIEIEVIVTKITIEADKRTMIHGLAQTTMTIINATTITNAETTGTLSIYPKLA